MKILDLQQGSQEWLQARASHFTASEAPAMMGASKYQTRNELLQLKATGIAPEVTEAQQYIFDKGHAAEAGARPTTEFELGEELFPATGVLEDSKLLASLDGMTMAGDIVWEHKLWNEGLAVTVREENLDPHYYWQLEQQLLVSGADRALFTCSDGTTDKRVSCWYESYPSRREQLLAGWAQFERDLANYKPEEVKAEVVAEKPADLPALIVDLVGEVRSSNLASFKDVVLARIDAVKTDLASDQDFADAEATVKFFSKGEKQLDEVKSQALAQTSSIDELFKTVDHLKDAMRTKRLALNKLVKDKKEQIRTNIVLTAKQALAEHIADIEADLGGYRLPTITADFAAAIKGKKSVAGLQSAADDELARAKIEANQATEKIQSNLAIFAELIGEYGFLFADKQQLIQLEADHLKDKIKSRIADHKEQERIKAEQERERIRAEEEARIRREQEAQAQAQAPKVEQQRQATPLNNHELIDVAAEDDITISRKEYEQLKRDSAMLAALQGAGVDSWDGYDHAMAMLESAA
ncbi:YqaJ viral recombinase family protein [Marinobacterium jannaschii]|uniref:YqaJ viral recombinase family protein n=1 Tax=Marinobacterium jannaschii TaxID=64970 RepID=UPI000688C3C4|nr:YqaJ viral recombinase family protein [Marinobacterium jannaschii]